MNAIIRGEKEGAVEKGVGVEWSVCEDERRGRGGKRMKRSRKSPKHSKHGSPRAETRERSSATYECKNQLIEHSSTYKYYISFKY